MMNDPAPFLAVIRTYDSVLRWRARQLAICTRGDFDQDDVYQAAVLGAWRAYQRHDSERQVLEKWLVNKALHAMIDYVRAMSRPWDMRRPSVMRDGDAERRAVCLDALADGVADRRAEASMRCSEARIDLAWLARRRRLKPRDHALLCDLFVFERPQREVAMERGVVPEAVAMAQKRALARLRGTRNVIALRRGSCAEPLETGR